MELVEYENIEKVDGLTYGWQCARLTILGVVYRGLDRKKDYWVFIVSTKKELDDVIHDINNSASVWNQKKNLKTQMVVDKLFAWNQKLQSIHARMKDEEGIE